MLSKEPCLQDWKRAIYIDFESRVNSCAFLEDSLEAILTKDLFFEHVRI